LLAPRIFRAVDSPGTSAPLLALVSMPYASVQRPSLALGLLKSVLEREGLYTRTFHLYLAWAQEVGLLPYLTCTILSPTDYMAGEWTFAGAAFREQAPDPEAYLAALPDAPPFRAQDAGRVGRGAFLSHLRLMRSRASGFVDRCARQILGTGAWAVGCSSTFEQNVASLALLRRIKEPDPGVVTLLGGGNCEAEMGQAAHRNFPWLDFVVSGEAEEILPALLRRILAEGPAIRDLPAGVSGPAHRQGATFQPGRGLAGDLDRLPIPDFEDYFRDLSVSPLAPALSLALPLETSRGCWWGARHRCTFCGLNGQALGYRAKSPERALEELRHLEARHGVSTLEMVDNIMSPSYFHSVLPALAQDPRRRNLFFEVKANLRREQVRLLARAGVRWIQPGIESLSTPVLRLMNKGVQAWQNIMLLRHAREFGVRLSWSILWGFPGEEDSWYHSMARLLPLLEHLQAPASTIRVRVDRFGSYHTRAVQEGRPLVLQAAIRHVYPLPARELMDLAYFFRFPGDSDPFDPESKDPSLPRALESRPGVRAMRAAVAVWKMECRKSLRPILTLAEEGEALRVLDSRRCRREFSALLEGPERDVLLACESAPALARLKAEGLGAVPAEQVARALDSLIQRRLVLELDGRAVALPVRGDLPAVPGMRDFPGGWADYTRIAGA
jgi:ribosomal peptide maturation radical SAM protein 1